MRKTILSLSILLACIISASAQNTVSFDNQSGQPALVKLIGSTSSEIEVPDGTKQSVQASAGKYVIKVRYGVPGKYHYTKGEEFTVDETATTRSKITITLHKVVNGNYDSRPINEEEFGVANATAGTPSRDTRENQSKEIHEAAKNGDLEKVKALLKDNPNLVFSKDDKYGETPLHLAASKGYKELTQLLLANKADVNAKANDGGTPIYIAAQEGHKDVVELLLANKADVNAKGKDGITPLYMAVQDDHKDVVELLLAKGADVNAKRNNGLTPLLYVAFKGHIDVAKLLLAKGADVNAKDNNGLTPLYWAAQAGHKDVVELLRQAGGHE